MKWLFILVFVMFLLGLQTDNFVLVDSNDQALADYLEGGFKYYKERGLSPLPPCSGSRYPVYVSSSAQYSAYAEITDSCVVRLVFRPSYTMRLVYHEVGHVFFGRYDESADYFWADEAVVEAMASVATRVYYFPYKFFEYRLYTINPFGLGEDRLDYWYKYSAAPAWHLEREDWRWTLRMFSTRRGAAELYVKFLIALAKGVEIGGRRFDPQRSDIDIVAGVHSFYVELDGYAASYYELRIARTGGNLKISVDSPAVVSNILLNREFYVDNSTIYLGLVNNSTQRVTAKVEVYYGQFAVRVASGIYERGLISLDLFAEYRGMRIDGVVKINGSDVVFRNGAGRFNFTGGLRPYVIKAEYGQQTVYINVDLRPVAVSISPRVLYLDQGGRGSLNVTIQNPNVVNISCILNGSATGVRFSPVRAVAPPNSTAVARLSFEVVGQLGSVATVSCGEWRESIPVRRPDLAVQYDLDSQRGVLEVRFGEVARRFEVGLIPTNVAVTHDGYTAMVVPIPQPAIKTWISSPKFSAGFVAYALHIGVDAPRWISFSGIVAVDGSIRGVYVGGVFNVTIYLRPGEVRRFYISVGRYTHELDLSAPRVETVVEPLSAAVEDGGVLLLAKARHSVELEGSALLEFGGPGFVKATQLSDALIMLEYKYAESLRIEYTAWGERRVLNITLPRPSVEISLIRGVVTPQIFRGVFNVTAKICDVSIRTRYVLQVEGKPLALYANPGRCSANFTTIERSMPYASEVNITVDASLSRSFARLSVPPPRVEVLRYLWIIDDSREALNLTLRAHADNYTYLLLGREIGGVVDIDFSAEASNGVAEIDYGFDTITLKRPPPNITTFPVTAEVGDSASLRVVISTPRELYIRGRLNTTFGSRRVEVPAGGSVEVDIPLPRNMEPGAHHVEVSLGPYRSHARVVRYEVNLNISAPQRVPVGYVVNIPVAGRVEPAEVNPLVVLEVHGCITRREPLRLGDVFTIALNKSCAVEIRAYTNSSSVSTYVEWASLGVEYRYESLGSVRGLPVFAPKTLTAEATLGGKAVRGSVKILGDFDKFGLVNYTVVVEHMGVVNRSTFVGVVAPAHSFKAAGRVASELPQESRPFFMYLVEKAALSGDWKTVDKISQIYSAPATPVALLARHLVQDALARGEEPNLEVIEALFKLEPVIYGVFLGIVLAAVRRFT